MGMVSIMAWRDDNGWQAEAVGEHNRLRGGRSRRRRAVKKATTGDAVRRAKAAQRGFREKGFQGRSSNGRPPVS